SLAEDSAGELPELIRGLVSRDRDERGEARYSLWYRAFWRVVEATPVAVPFLVELLSYPQVHCPAQIVNLLGTAAWRSATLEHRGLWPRPDDEPETDESRERRAREDEWGRQTRRAIWNGLDILLVFLTDPNKWLRIAAPFALGRLVEHGQDDMP